MELTQAADKYVFGTLLVEELPIIAVEALVAGIDSPSLRQLAGADSSCSEDIKKLFLKTLEELKIQLPSPEEAGLSMARSIAVDVIQGKISPYEGAKQIWVKIYTPFPQLTQLRSFVGFASEYEDDEKHRDEYSRDIVEKCKRLVG